MRVIEPNSFSKKTAKPKKHIFGKLLLVIIIVVSSYYGWKVFGSKTSNQSTRTGQNTLEQSSKQDNNSEKTIKILSADDFSVLNNTTAYPNTKEIDEPISITQNYQADQKIREIAEQRGYIKRPLPIANLVKIDNQLLQQKAVVDWQAMQASAKTSGVKISIGSGFRSPAQQREIFLSRLKSRGISITQIAKGQANQEVEQLLTLTAPPGYSRHQTGYAVDIACDNQPTTSFVYTVCFEWLSKDNYLNTKTHGWIPSYPEGAKLQGPEPEPWEYVWVGYDSLLSE